MKAGKYNKRDVGIIKFVSLERSAEYITNVNQ